MRDPAEEDLDAHDLVEQLKDRHGKHYGRLLSFAHVVQRRALEDVAREHPEALAAFWQLTNNADYS